MHSRRQTSARHWQGPSSKRWFPRNVPQKLSLVAQEFAQSFIDDLPHPPSAGRSLHGRGRPPAKKRRRLPRSQQGTLSLSVRLDLETVRLGCPGSPSASARSAGRTILVDGF
jgi:hypothetical protein